MPIPIALAAIAGASALAKGIQGVAQQAQANRLDRRNRLPIQSVQGEYFQNVADAEQMARIGTPSAQYNQSLNNINRNFAGALRQFGGRNQSLASMIRATNDNTMQLDANSANNRIRNRMNLFQQRNILAGQKQNAFDWNRKQPYVANLAKAEALRGAGTQNMMGMFSDMTQGAAMIAANGKG